MSDELFAGFEFPPTPSLEGDVLRRLDARPERRFPARTLTVVLALVACALLLAFSERARSAVEDILDLVPGVEIQRSSGLPPPAAMLAPLSDFGRPVTLAEATILAGFPLRLPEEIGSPDRVFVDRGAGGAAVTAVWGGESDLASVILTQWSPARLLFRKLVLSPDTLVDSVDVDGTKGLWIRGEEHEVFYVGMDGRSRRGEPVLAGRVLAWERDGVVYRIEADVPLQRMLRLAHLTTKAKSP